MAPLIGELSAKLTERFLQRPDGHTPIGSMWYGLRALQGRPRPTNLSGLLGHLPYKGRHNDERIAEGDKPRATNHEPLTTNH